MDKKNKIIIIICVIVIVVGIGIATSIAIIKNHKNNDAPADMDKDQKIEVEVNTYYNDYVEHGEEQTDNAESSPKNNNTDQEIKAAISVAALIINLL